MDGKIGMESRLDGRLFIMQLKGAGRISLFSFVKDPLTKE